MNKREAMRRHSRKGASMRKLRAFLLGMWEFRSSFTTYFGGDLIESYDSGREWAHRLTLRGFEQ